jgi:hypothetical protein
MCAEKANISHKHQKKCNFCTQNLFSPLENLGKSAQINVRLPLIFSAGGRNNIVYSSEWLLVWNTSVITKTK